MVSSVQIVPLKNIYISEVVALQPLCFPPPFPPELLWKAEHLEHHLRVFPEGQMVALADGKVLGSGTSMIISENNWNSHGDFDATVGTFLLDNHDPKGTTMYGVDISVHPDFRGHGIGRKIYAARFELVKKLNLKRYGTSVRIPDFHTWHHQTNGGVKEYTQLVSEGKVVDRTLTPMIKFGLKLEGIVEGHMNDAESGNAAAVLVWVPTESTLSKL